MATNCPYCGAPLHRPTARFCPVCGKPLPVPPVAPPPPPKPLPANTPPPTQRIGTAQPAQLMIQEVGRPVRTVTLSVPSLLGSTPAPDGVTVPHPAVAPRHALFDQRGADLVIIDLGSANGTTVNGQRLTSHAPQRLVDGDLIRIADVNGNSVGITFRGGPVAPSIISVELGKLQLDQTGVITLGRDPANSVRLDHPTVSRFHAEVRRTPQGDILSDQSANGVYVNGQRVQGRHRLKNGDVVQIGPFKLTYDQSSLTQAGATGLYRLDAIHLSRKVTVGGSALSALPGGARGGTLKLILNDVNLSIHPREFVALVGGSGAGKSTLMKALSGFTPAQGQVLLNGDDLYQNFGAYRSILGYVPQDDIIHHQLTVRSALQYAAQLRLPDATAPEIEQRVTDVLGQVEMANHAGKQVQQLSGGQRKRVSIAVELLAEPGLFFLDEPTSGLDPGLEKKMMHTLRQLADAGRTIVLVTHATANIDQCDHVAFMADGQLTYYGPPADALTFFGARDFADIYTRLTHPIDPSTNPPPVQWRPPPAPPGAPPAPYPPAAEVWATCYRSSPQYQQYVATRLQNTPAPAPVPAAPPAGSSKQKDSPLRQFLVLAQRHLDLLRHDAVSLVTLLAIMPVIGLLLLVMAGQHDLTGLPPGELRTEVQQGIEDAWITEDDPFSDSDQFQGTYQVAGAAQTLLFMLALAANLLGVFAASYEIVREEAIYQRERMVNLKLGPYLFSKIVVLGIFALVQCALLLWVVGRRILYPEDGVFMPVWLELYITLVLASITGIMLGLLLSAIVRSQATVIYLILFVIFVQILFAGAIFSLPGAATTLSYVTPTRWALEALGGSVDMEHLNEMSVTCVEPETQPAGLPLQEGEDPCEDGQQRLTPKLEFNVVYEHSANHLLTRWAALVMISCVLGGLTYVVQKRKDVV